MKYSVLSGLASGALLTGLLALPLPTYAQPQALVLTANIPLNNYVSPVRITPFSRTDTDTYDISLPLPQFDPSLGPLRGVSARIFGVATVAFSGLVGNPEFVPFFAGVNANVSMNFSLLFPNGIPPLSITLPLFNQSGTFPNPGPVSLSYPVQEFDSGFHPLPSSSLPTFIGMSVVPLTFRQAFTQQVTISNGDVASRFLEVTQPSVQIAYIYGTGGAAPEPSSFLLVLPFALLSAVLRPIFPRRSGAPKTV